MARVSLRLVALQATDLSFAHEVGSKGAELGQFHYPRGLAVSGGELVVADSRNHRLQAVATIASRSPRGLPVISP